VPDALAAQSPEPPDPHASGWEYPDTWLRDGDSVPCGARRLEVVGTPGHTQGHVVFHESQEGLLFAGDHVLATITPSIAVEPVLAENPLADFLASLAKVRQLPDVLSGWDPGQGDRWSDPHLTTRLRRSNGLACIVMCRPTPRRPVPTAP
jgi:glyoxylase-like metal-dependent hydrolase (beta-lactamase superfamily II)